MKKNKPYIDIVNSAHYLVADLKGLGLYERANAINRFIRKDTLILETHLDNEIKSMLAEYGIISTLNDKDQINCALESLRRLHRKEIVIKDIYENIIKDNHLTIVGISSNHMTVVIEDDRYIQCGIELYIRGLDDDNLE